MAVEQPQKQEANASAREIILILDNIRSAHNVGAILRSADVFGVKRAYCCGITPHPQQEGDERLPYIASRAHKMIAKTALGAEHTVKTSHFTTTKRAVAVAKQAKYHIYALEQAKNSRLLGKFRPEYPCALVLGNEVDGVDQKILAFAEEIIEIPQLGQKESLNVSVAAGIALYHLTQ